VHGGVRCALAEPFRDVAIEVGGDRHGLGLFAEVILETAQWVDHRLARSALVDRVVGLEYLDEIAEGHALFVGNSLAAKYVGDPPPKDNLNRWLTERRNVYEDYRTVFGEDPVNPQAVIVSIDTNDTHSGAEAFIGRIIFTNGSGEAALNR
jgi:hypothetical protein